MNIVGHALKSVLGEQHNKHPLLNGRNVVTPTQQKTKKKKKNSANVIFDYTMIVISEVGNTKIILP